MILQEFEIETVMLAPNMIIMKSDTELTQYFIKDWQFTFINKGMILKR